MTLNGFIMIIIVLCCIGWLGAHIYDDIQAKRVHRAFRRDRDNH